MKNLFGANAPTNRILGSFTMLMLILLVAIGFTSCKDQSKSEVSPETELTAKVNLQGVQSNFDIEGHGDQKSLYFEIGGKGSKGTSSGGECTISDIGGRGTTGEYSISDIGGKNTSSTGNHTLNVTEVNRDVNLIRRIPESFTADIGGRGTSGTGF
jgi:hypothetical protein